MTAPEATRAERSARHPMSTTFTSMPAWRLSTLMPATPTDEPVDHLAGHFRRVGAHSLLGDPVISGHDHDHLAGKVRRRETGDSRDLFPDVEELPKGPVRHEQGLGALVRAPPPFHVDVGDPNTQLDQPSLRLSFAGLIRSGIPLTRKYTSSAARAITSLARPAQSRNRLPRAVSGTTPEPTSLVTTITAAPWLLAGALDERLRARLRRALIEKLVGEEEIGHPQRDTVQQDGAAPGAAPPPPLPATRIGSSTSAQPACRASRCAAMRAPHLLVQRLGGRDVRARALPLLREAQGEPGLSAPAPACDEDQHPRIPPQRKESGYAVRASHSTAAAM